MPRGFRWERRNAHRETMLKLLFMEKNSERITPKRRDTQNKGANI
jgi:hypothetical protein